MFDFDASCPDCEKKFKLNRIGLEAKEFIQCPHCRRIIILDARFTYLTPDHYSIARGNKAGAEMPLSCCTYLRVFITTYL